MNNSLDPNILQYAYEYKRHDIWDIEVPRCLRLARINKSMIHCVSCSIYV